MAISEVQTHREVQHITIEVHGDRDHTIPHAITIESVRPYTQPGEPEAPLEWSANRVSDRGTNRVTASECPALDEVVAAFPEIADLTSEVGGTLPIEPTLKDGFGTRSVVISEGVSTEVKGSEYEIWGHNAVSKLLRCWEPLIPDTSSRYWERIGRR